ncbi:Nudix hydrolase 12, mitochondrial-like protein [Drosera capensis]
MEVCGKARTGRERQRYDGKQRLVSGCIPYRLRSKYEDHGLYLEDMLEVLMISTPNRDDLVFPKGGWENDETVYEAATREALEEAGVKGILHKEALGVWEFRSKSKQKMVSAEGGCKGYMFAMKVTEELEAWPEQELYGRKWLSIKEAFKQCRYDWMREALQAFLDFMEKEQDSKTRNAMASSMGVLTFKSDCRYTTKPANLSTSSFYKTIHLVVAVLTIIFLGFFSYASIN